MRRLKSLTLQQVRDIYADRLTTWENLADPAAIAAGKSAEKIRDSYRFNDEMRITPLWRQRDSGSRELFDALMSQVPESPESEIRHADLFACSMSGPYNRVTTDPLALGYSVYSYKHFMALSAFTRNIAIDGVEPTFDTIASGQYPLTSPVYATCRESDAPDSPGRKLMQRLLTDEGQALIRESGYVPIR